MQIKYYQSAWSDIKNSPGWFGKLCLIALVSCVPVFGQIVAFGYLYGWAREIAWGTHQPMPAKLICNEDGKFWRRGWFAVVIAFVFALLPAVVGQAGTIMQDGGFAAVAGRGGQGAAALASLGSLLYVVGLVGSVFVAMLAWIAIMRMSIYDRLSAGFQLGKVWKMFRKDPAGIFKILGMEVLVGIVLGLLLSIVASILLTLVVFTGVAGLISSGYALESIEYMTDAETLWIIFQLFASAGVVGIVCMLGAWFVSMLATAFINALVARAVGYWTMQFEVPRWRGQDDPMPFEIAAPAGYAGPYDGPQR